MPTTYKTIVINQGTSFGGDDMVDQTEGGATGFTINGTGGYSGTPPANGATLSVTLSYFDGTNTVTQTFIATISNVVGGSSKTFDWTLHDTSLGGTALATGAADTVHVISFGGTTTSSPNVTFDYACFVAGTRILTPSGEVAVEDLDIGDQVLTLYGETEAVIWTGNWDARIDDAADRAVRITAHAFGPGRPARDLLVSPKHGIWIDGVSVPAIALLDGVRVLREPARALIYHHIAVPYHAVILADGMPSETFCPIGSVPVYADMPEVANPLPRLEGGEDLRHLRARHILAEPASQPGALRGQVERITATEDGLLVEGWASEGPHPLTLRLVAGDVVREVPANGWRTDLDRAGLPAAAFSALLPVSAETKVQVFRSRDGASLRSRVA